MGRKRKKNFIWTGLKAAAGMGAFVGVIIVAYRMGKIFWPQDAVLWEAPKIPESVSGMSVGQTGEIAVSAAEAVPQLPLGLKPESEPQPRPRTEPKPQPQTESQRWQPGSLRTRRKAKRKGRLRYFGLIFMALMASLLCMFFGIARVEGDSMSPQFRPGELLVYQKAYEKLEYGGVIVFERGGLQYVKRIIGMPGDELDITEDGTVLVNGKSRPIKDLYFLGDLKKADIKFPVTVPEQCYFVLGDNRSVSLDSRYTELGYVKQEEIKGLVVISVDNLA